MARTSLATSESVTEGHPDKVADQVSDAVLDAVLAADPAPGQARVAVETLATTGLVVVAGEISTQSYVDMSGLVRQTVKSLGYDRSTMGFDGNTCGVLVAIDEQSPDIAGGVSHSLEARRQGLTDELDSLGAGDQGLMVGYACDETETLMPLSIHLAHRMAEQLARVRHRGVVPYLRPDGKAQITIAYDGDQPARVHRLVVSSQHQPDIDTDTLLAPDVLEHVVAPCVPDWLDFDEGDVLVNPSGRFELGGPQADTGITGRKTVVDTYGSKARPGGGALSGKDATKVDRSATYAARWVAKTIVAAGLARRAELELAYAIGVAHPVAVRLETFGTEQADPDKILAAVHEVFDLRPAAIIRDLNLLTPGFTQTACYGHFGRPDAVFAWERTDRVAALQAAVGA
jgi:S-adenosylmethionine synthetase